MKLLFYLLFFICFYSTQVASRTLHTDGNELASSELEAQKQMRLGPKSEDNIIWTKVESKSELEVDTDRDGNNSGKGNLILQPSFEIPKSDEENGSEEKETKAEGVEILNENGEPLGTESLFTEDSERTRMDSMEIYINRSLVNNTDLKEFSEFHASNSGNLSSSMLPEIESGNFSDVVVFNFLDFNEDATVVGSLESIPSNDTLVMSEEDDIALFGEVTTFGFEFLIDSLTTRNSLLSELLSSESALITMEENDALTILGNEENFTLEMVNISINQTGNELNPSFLSEEIHVLSTAEDVMEELKIGKIELNTRDMNSMGNDHEITEEVAPACPEPGWCFLWFLSQDTCAENNHCLGSRICCKSGCSKTCIDI